MSQQEFKERMERYVLKIAREVGIPIPNGEIKGEGPDFRFESETPPLGIEVSEVLRSADSNKGLSPVAEAARHQAIISTADKKYHSDPQAKPVSLQAYWEDARGKLPNWDETSDALVEFVRTHVHLAQPAEVFYRPEIPKGFSSVLLETAWRNEWHSLESGGYKWGQIKPQVEARIAEKNNLVASYRSRMAAGSHQWLLLYSDVSIPRGMMIPADAGDWQCATQFDRIFWVNLLEKDSIELKRS